MSISKKQYRIAKASGNLEMLRGKQISARIGQQKPLQDQLAVVMNALEYLYKAMQTIHGIDLRSKEWTEYEKLRDSIKASVDKELSELEE